MPYVTSHKLPIYYEVHGDAEDVMVLAHGMGGNAAIWFNQIAHYQERYRVIAFDHRHFGRSHCDVSQFNPAWFADDVIKILEAEQVSSAVWICQSMGGWTGSQMALQYPEKVKALVMSHTPGVFEHHRAVNDSARLAKTIASGLLPALAEDFPQKNPAMASLYAGISSFNNIENANVPRKIGEAKMGQNIEGLSDYVVPTLFVTGDQDVLFEASYIKALSEELPGARYVNLGQVGHSSYFESPDRFNRAVDDFLGALQV